jgi:hypothetical protein
MPKRHPFLAVAFLLGGLSFAAGFGVLVVLGNMEAGMSAGSVPASPSIVPIVVATEAYFILGVIATLFSQSRARRVLAVASHVALVFTFIYLCYIGAPVFNIISAVILTSVVIYGYSWFIMTKNSNAVV